LKTVFSKIQHKIYNGYALSLKAEKVRLRVLKQYILKDYKLIRIAVPSFLLIH